MTDKICIVMAVFRPEISFLEAQIKSISDQQDARFSVIFVDADTRSSGDISRLAEAANLRFEIISSTGPLDAVRAFEFGLAQAVSRVDDDGFIAFCDQDDIWHPTRLARGVATLGATGADLVHSDARLVDDTGALVHGSMFRYEKRRKKPGARGLLYRNTVTGMTVLMRASLAKKTLPFPRQSGVHFYHDLWVALVAECENGVALIDAPLVDYRQHGANAIGAVTEKSGFSFPNGARLRQYAAGYGLARFLAHSAMARLGETSHRKLAAYRNAWRGFATHLFDALALTLRGKFGLAKSAASFAIVLLGRQVWALRQLFSKDLGRVLNDFDERLYSLSPGVSAPQIGNTKQETKKSDYENIADQRTELCWQPGFDDPDPRLTILLPTLNPTEIFAGIATAVDIGCKLAEQGHKIRFIATDLPVSSMAATYQFISFRTKADAESIAIHCGVSEDVIPAHRHDRYLATAWWTAHLADELIKKHAFTQSKFFYLIQDYEPNFYSWGPEFAEATASYGLNFTPIFNTSLLRDYFTQQGYGFATPEALCFRPSIDLDVYQSGDRSPDPAKRRLAVYGRPEVDRNMFTTAVEALARFVRTHDIAPDTVELVSVGLKHGDVTLPNGHVLRSLGKLTWDEYPGFLRSLDMGLSLMYSPHPSHLPLEMAASGVRVLSNRFDNKDLSQLSPAIVSCEPNVAAVAEGLKTIWDMPPTEPADRQVDLAKLGATLDDMLCDFGAQLDKDYQAQQTNRRLYLHIGAPKCGSTYLQRVMLKNHKTLLQQGVLYPHTGQGHAGTDGEILTYSAAQLAELFADTDVVFMSHEDLFSKAKMASNFAKHCKELNIDVQIIAFFRPFDEIVFGDYSQFVKKNFSDWIKTRDPFEGQSFEEFVARRAKVLLPTKFFTDWNTAVPDNPIMLRSHRDIRQTIQEIFPDITFDWHLNAKQTNPSIAMEDCERLVTALADKSIPAEDLEPMYQAVIADLGAPHDGPASQSNDFQERRDLISAVFEEQYAGLQSGFGFDPRKRD